MLRGETLLDSSTTLRGIRRRALDDMLLRSAVLGRQMKNSIVGLEVKDEKLLLNGEEVYGYKVTHDGKRYYLYTHNHWSEWHDHWEDEK